MLGLDSRVIMKSQEARTSARLTVSAQTHRKVRMLGTQILQVALLLVIRFSEMVTISL